MTRRGWMLFAAMSVIWGIPYLLIKVAVTEVAPPVVVAFRTSVAMLLLLPVAAVRGAVRPALRRWPAVLLFALVEMALPWILLANAEQGLSSSLTGLLVATVPLVGTAIAFGLGDRTVLRPVRLAGLAVGLTGVALVVGLGRDGGGGTREIIEVLLVAVCYAIGPFLITHWLDGVPSLGVISVSIGAVALLYAGPAVAAAPDGWPSPTVLAALLGLAVVCTGLAFIGFFALVDEVGPMRAPLITFVNPVVAISLGVVVLDEPLTAGLVIGFPLVLAGCWLASRSHPDVLDVDTDPGCTGVPGTHVAVPAPATGTGST